MLKPLTLGHIATLSLPPKRWQIREGERYRFGRDVRRCCTTPDLLPSVNVNSLLWKITMFNGKTHDKWPCSIDFCMFTFRGFLGNDPAVVDLPYLSISILVCWIPFPWPVRVQLMVWGQYVAKDFAWNKASMIMIVLHHVYIHIYIHKYIYRSE